MLVFDWLKVYYKMVCSSVVAVLGGAGGDLCKLPDSFMEVKHTSSPVSTWMGDRQVMAPQPHVRLSICVDVKL